MSELKVGDRVLWRDEFGNSVGPGNVVATDSLGGPLALVREEDTGLVVFAEGLEAILTEEEEEEAAWANAWPEHDPREDDWWDQDWRERWDS